MTAPRWATDLAAEVWAAEGGLATMPELQWWRTSHQYSSGRTSLGRIHVSAGEWSRAARKVRGIRASDIAAWRQRERRDQRVVLLHELAHAIVMADIDGLGEHHSERFWRVAWSLYMRYRADVPLAYVLQREGDYRSTALQVAVGLGIHGARAAAHARKGAAMPTTTKATKAKTKPAKKAATKATGTKVCPGVPGLEGYPAHEAPVSEFASNAYNKDGLSRKCRVCWPAYTKSLKAKKAGTDEAPAPEADPATEAPAEAPSEPEAAPEPSTPEVEVQAVPEPLTEAGTESVASLMAMPVDGEPAARRKRIQRERALARAGGAGTEQGQALLAQWDAEAKRARKAVVA